MDIAELIAERLIREGIEDGAFENLAGKGQPIDDLDRSRDPGWWAARTVKEERARDSAGD